MAQDNNEQDVIDITNVVTGMKKTFVTWATDFIFTEIIATPGFQWVALPVLNVFIKDLIYFIVGFLSTSGVMEAFFVNTSVRKSSQAQDYLAALTAKENLPANVSDGDYEKAEQDEINSFNSFVVLGN